MTTSPDFFIKQLRSKSDKNRRWAALFAHQLGFHEEVIDELLALIVRESAEGKVSGDDCVSCAIDTVGLMLASGEMDEMLQRRVEIALLIALNAIDEKRIPWVASIIQTIERNKNLSLILKPELAMHRDQLLKPWQVRLDALWDRSKVSGGNNESERLD